MVFQAPQPHDSRRRQVLSALAAISTCGLPASFALAANSVAEFDFHHSISINLHHFLYQSARRNPHLIDQHWFKPPDQSQQQLFLDAIAFYKQHYSDLDLLFDNQMYAIKLQLSQLADQALDLGKLSATSFNAELRSILQTTLPAYHACLWPLHQQSNLNWQRRVSALNAAHGAEIWQTLNQKLAPARTNQPIRVDLVHLTGIMQGAYTENETRQIVMPSGRSDYQSFYGLEMLYHEASHIDIISPIFLALIKEFEKLGRQPDRNLWHAIQFYTVGKTCQQVLAKRGIAYLPYHENRRLFELAPGWQAYTAVISQHWQAWLDGKISQATALQRMAGDLT